jgi:hypothetical protein
LKRFVDDIVVEIIEVNLLSLLHGIFSPLTVTTMADHLVTRIAGESEENRAQREQFKRQLEVLRNGLETCKRFVGVIIPGESCPTPAIELIHAEYRRRYSPRLDVVEVRFYRFRYYS